MKLITSSSIRMAVLSAVAGFACHTASADSSGTFTITLDGSITLSPDLTTLTVATPPSGSYAARIGEQTAPGASIYEIAYQLPTSLPSGESYSASGTSLRLQLYAFVNASGTIGNVDLYGLTARASSTILSSDFYVGPSDSSSTLIEDNLLVPTSPVRTDPNTGPFITTDANGDLALANYLNLQWAGGANAGKYVFLRFSYDIAAPLPNGNDAYTVLTNEAGGSNEKPLLSFSTAATPVPEPSSYAAVIGLGCIGLIVLRRRKLAQD